MAKKSSKPAEGLGAKVVKQIRDAAGLNVSCDSWGRDVFGSYSGPLDIVEPLRRLGVKINDSQVMDVLRGEVVAEFVKVLARYELYALPAITRGTPKKIVATLAAHGIQCPIQTVLDEIKRKRFYRKLGLRDSAATARRKAKLHAG